MKQKCHWDGCKTPIEVKQISSNSMFVTVGWCNIHQDAFRRYTKMEQRYCKRNRLHWPVGSLTYKNHKKAFNELHFLAGKQAEMEAKYNES